jgi:NADH-quinone oxidoreductase subunit C
MSLVLELLYNTFPTAILDSHDRLGEDTVTIDREHLLPVAGFLREEASLDFQVLTDLTVVDRHPAIPRFEVVYHFLSMKQNLRLRIKIPVGEEDPQVPSLTPLWPGADWLEREAWDMFGVVFSGHPHLQRILMYEEFEGHPLRKDYPYRKRQPLIGPQN